MINTYSMLLCLAVPEHKQHIFLSLHQLSLGSIVLVEYEQRPMRENINSDIFLE